MFFQVIRENTLEAQLGRVSEVRGPSSGCTAQFSLGIWVARNLSDGQTALYEIPVMSALLCLVPEEQAARDTLLSAGPLSFPQSVCPGPIAVFLSQVWRRGHWCSGTGIRSRQWPGVPPFRGNVAELWAGGQTSHQGLKGLWPGSIL